MTRKDRVWKALQHHQPDFIPFQVDFTQQEHDRVADFLRDPAFEPKIGGHIERANFSGPMGPETERPGFFRDDFGVIWNKTGVDRDIGMMDELLIKEPDISTYRFPELDEAAAHAKFRSLVENGRDTFKIGRLSMALYERAWSLRGMENLLCDMLQEPAFVDALLEKITDYTVRIIDIGLSYPEIDGFYFGDDWGQQTPGLIMGRRSWQRFLKPHLKRMYGRIKSKGRFVIQHSCGNILELYPELIEIGLDVHNTFQPGDLRHREGEEGVRKRPRLVGRHQHPEASSLRDPGESQGRDHPHHADRGRRGRLHRGADSLHPRRRARRERPGNGRRVHAPGKVPGLRMGMAQRTIVASAPAKVILLGGKGVNWGFPALVAAVGIRTICTLHAAGGEGYRFTYGERNESGDAAALASFKARVQALREAKDHGGITAIARSDFFAPVRNVLAHVVERTRVLGFDIEWTSDIPVGSGLGSGAAAAASLAAAAFRAGGASPEPRDLAWVAWQADVIAHGGLGTGLDSGACSLGGIVRYTLKDGPSRLPGEASLPLVVGDTLLRASTATSNTASRNWLDEHPMRFHLLEEMGILVDQAQAAIIASDLPRLGHLMNLNQLIKEKLGLSVPKTEELIEAALGAGALGAKISGKGMGGIIVALAGPGKQQEVARAIEAAGRQGNRTRDRCQRCNDRN